MMKKFPALCGKKKKWRLSRVILSDAAINQKTAQLFVKKKLPKGIDDNPL